jgi:hypothetical protein
MTKLLIQKIFDAFDWMRAHGYQDMLDDDLQAEIASLKFRLGMSLADIEDEYATTLYEIMDDYANSERPVTSFRNRYARAANDAMNLAVVAGWSDGGADGPIPSELQSWVNGRIDQERDYISDMFRDLRELRKTATPDELANFIHARAEGYTGSLEGVYLQGKAYAMGERPGRWELGATQEHCISQGGTMGCAELSGQVHPVNWYIQRGYIPRQPGNPNLTCHGFHCDCRVVDPETGEQLL